MKKSKPHRLYSGQLSRVGKAIANIRIAEEQALIAVKAAIAEVAKEEGIDRMLFGYTTTLYRNGEETESEAIEKLENLYLTQVYPIGFLDLWEKGKGWIDGRTQ